MTEVLCRMEFNKLTPDSEDAYRVFSKVKGGSRVVADIKDATRRSGQQHRFWFVMAHLIFDSQEYFKDFDTFRKCLLIKLGFCDTFTFKDGTQAVVAHSLKFSKMPPDEFGRLVDATLDFAVSVGFDRDALLAETNERAA